MQNNFNFLPDNEYNNTAPETKGQNEVVLFGENLCSQEMSRQNEINDNTQKPSKKTKPSKVVTTLLATTVAAVGIGSATVLAPTTSPKAEILELWSTNNQVGYFIEVEDFKDTNLNVVLYNDFTNRVEPLEVEEYVDDQQEVVGYAEGEIEFLQKGMQYTIAVVQGEGLGKKTLTQKTIYTKNQEVVLAKPTQFDIWSNNYQIGYFFEAEDVPDDNLMIEVSNGEESTEYILEVFLFEDENGQIIGGAEGFVYGLQRGTQYTVDVVQYDGCEKHVIATKQIETTDVSANPTLLELWSTNNEVGCFIEMTQGHDLDLRVEVYNDDTKQEQYLYVSTYEDENGQTVGNAEGIIDGLQRGTQYTLEIVQYDGDVKHTLLKQSVSTTDEPVVEWRGITERNNNDVDGYFYFTMDFVDETGDHYENIENYFIATLTDTEGNYNSCFFTEDLHGEQKISISAQDPMTDSIALVGETATLEIVFIWIDDGGVEHTEYLYTAEIYL